MKTRDDAKTIFTWLLERQSATAAQIASAVQLSSEDVSRALQYVLRLQVFISKRRSAEKQGERVVYSVACAAFPNQRSCMPRPSFDALLSAWGMALVPPPLRSVSSRVCVLAHDEPF